MTRGALLAAATAAAAGCATLRPMEPPAGRHLHGLAFGQERDRVEQDLRAAGIAARPDPSDDDVLFADRCPGAATDGPCRLRFGPAGLQASEVQAPADGDRGLERLVAWLSSVWGRPDRDWHPAVGAPAAAHWQARGWTLIVARSPGADTALVRAEWDAATPPTVAGVPLGTRRQPLEALLARLGAVRVDRDDTTTTYLGCPDGAPDASTCVVEFQQGRAAAVVEGFGSLADDREALAAWRARTAGLERELGRPPAISCPDQGPDRITGGCTATWIGARLLVTVGASRNAGGRHRGDISLWTSWAYPPLQAGAQGPVEPGPPPPEAAPGRDSSK